MVFVEPNNFTGELITRYIDGKTWEVWEDFEYHIGHYHGEELVRIGAGMLTDFASIPVVVRLLYRSPGGPWDKPAVVHDCLYRTGYVENMDGTRRKITRKEADDIFFEAMGVAGVPIGDALVIYRGVRIGGWWAWGKHRRNDEREADACGAGQK